jgi:hypothetical protein
MSRRSGPPTAITQSAVEMIVLQLGCSEAEALERLRTRAEYGQYRLHNYARLVVDGIVRFDAGHHEGPLSV